MKASESESESEPALKVRKLSEKTTATRGYLIFHLFILPYFLKHLNIRQRLECRKHKNIINNFFHFHFHFDWSQLRPLHWLASSVCIWSSEAAQGNSWTLFQFHFFSAAALVIAPPPTISFAIPSPTAWFMYFHFYLLKADSRISAFPIQSASLPSGQRNPSCSDAFSCEWMESTC